MCITIPQVVFSQLQTERIFTNGMVLQRDMEVPVWGVANPFDTVVVTVGVTSDTAWADESGNWELSLDAMGAGGPCQMIISNGDQTITRSNVYIGDVWLAAGQSNTERRITSCLNKKGRQRRPFRVDQTVEEKKLRNLPEFCQAFPEHWNY